MDPPGASLRLPPAPSPPMVGAKDPRRSEFSWHRGWPRWPGEDNHVHLLIQYPPKVSVPSLVNSLKGGSSRMFRQERPDLRKQYWKRALWSPSYFAASWGGAPISILKKYVDRRQPPS